MVNKRTTSVDRRLVIHVAQAIPEDVPEEVIKAHLQEAALSHRLIRGLLSVDPAMVNEEVFFQVLGGKIREFKDPNSVLERIHALGGLFAQARLTTVPGGETLGSQRDRVIVFWTDWHWKDDERVRLTVAPSIASQVVYLEGLVEGSLGCTYDKTEEEGRKYVQGILDSLPKVKGLRWTLGNTPTVNRILANHLKETGKYLLPYVYTWTTDEYENKTSGLCRLVAGVFHSLGVFVRRLRPCESNDFVGLFVLGVPE